MTETAVTRGAHHIGLTVPDLAGACAFFADTLGFTWAGVVPNYPAVFMTDGTIMITLWQAADPANAISFDRKNHIGLHHFALTVEDAGILDDLYHTLDGTNGVDIEFAPEPLGGGPNQHMMCFIPDAIRMELIAPSG